MEIRYQNAKHPEIVVCESAGVWAGRLQVALAGCSVKVFQTRNLDDLADQLSSGYCALVTVELRPSWLEGIVRLLGRIRREHRQTESVVVHREATADEIWWLREAGATATISSEKDVIPVIRLVRRQLQRFTKLAAECERDVIEIQLPWR